MPIKEATSNIVVTSRKGSALVREIHKKKNQISMREEGEAISKLGKLETLPQQVVRETLPIFSVRDELLQVVRENQVVVLVGETGCGKTTQITQYLYEDGYKINGIIGCTPT
ncbi:hypothetical protein P3L10_032200 [Capsicum annuum]